MHSICSAVYSPKLLAISAGATLGSPLTRQLQIALLAIVWGVSTRISGLVVRLIQLRLRVFALLPPPGVQLQWCPLHTCMHTLHGTQSRMRPPCQRNEFIIRIIIIICWQHNAKTFCHLFTPGKKGIEAGEKPAHGSCT